MVEVFGELGALKGGDPPPRIARRLPPGVAFVLGGVIGVPVVASLVADFFNRDFPGVSPAAWLGLELAGEEYMFCFQTTLRPGVVEGAGVFF